MSGIGGPQTNEERPAAIVREISQREQTSEAGECDKQAQNPALDLHHGLDFLANRAGAR